MGRIQKLSDELANQIAAGEVVERPASIVKELVENSLDAKATRIVVDVEHGGSVLVRVTDDGDGMSEEEALLSLERHATSKIRELDDLFRLGTFGFRGEALPSIASVSRLLLRTRARGADEGCEVEVHGGRFADPPARPAGGATGTTIEVRELFFNVPARRKFLKATATESAHIGDVVLGAALGRPDVTFTLNRDGRTVREYLRSGSRADRARAASTGESLAHVIGARGPLRVEAMLAAPERARAGTTGLAILVNGRAVRDRVLARAVAHAYGSVLDGGRYPVGVVWVDLPPSLVDVNVHPQKAEVRFTDARGVFDAITRELHTGLARAFGLPDLAGSPFAAGARANAPTLSSLEVAAAAAKARLSETGARPFEVGGEPRPQLPLTPQPSAIPPTAGAPPTTLPRYDAALLPEENLFGAVRLPSAAASTDEPQVTLPRGAADLAHPLGEPAPPELFAARGLYESLRYIGQARGTFLLCEGEEGVFVLDQHAAAERVTFDRLRRAHASRAIATQRLLVPEVVDLPPAEVALLDEASEEVAQLGIEVRAVGDAAVAVHAVPALLARAQPKRLVRDLASELSRAGGRDLSGAIDLVLATMACHGSLRAGDAVSADEVRALLAALDTVDFAGHCPHGRPIVMRLPWQELERRVGR